MRVLNVDAGRQMRGGQWQVIHLMEALVARGLQAALLARAGGPLLREAQRRGLQAWELSLAALRRAAVGVDVVHAHDARGHTLAALMGVRPLVVSRRVAFPVGRGPLSRWKYGRADRLIAISAHVAARLREAGIAEERISVVYDGVPALEASKGGVAVAPASDDPAKGEALARAAARLAGVELTVSRNLHEDLARASYLVYLSDAEGLGSAVVWAASAGVPAIASRVGGLVEAVEDGRTGILCENRVEEVADAMRRLEGSPELVAALGAGARQRFERLFAVDRMADETIEVYRRVTTAR